jgi:hypothetical protein
MECLVYRVPMRDPGDASGITGLIEGALAADEILAIFGKTEGNSQRCPTNDDERNTLYQRHRWEVVGPNPL